MSVSCVPANAQVAPCIRTRRGRSISVVLAKRKALVLVIINGIEAGCCLKRMISLRLMGSK